jgi:hypothetical protein
MDNYGAIGAVFVVQINALFSHCLDKVDELFWIFWAAEIWPYSKVHLFYKFRGDASVAGYLNRNKPKPAKI